MAGLVVVTQQRAGILLKLAMATKIDAPAS
jgi:hypothetical protein